MANQIVQEKPVQSRTAKRVERHLGRYNGSDALLKRYKSLVENSRKGKNGSESLAEFNGGRLISAFTALNYTVNWDDVGTIDSRISELCISSLDILQKIIAQCPENIDDYANVFETIGGVYKKREYAQNVVPMLEISLSIMNGWKNLDSEEMETRFRVLTSSIKRCIGIIAKLNEHGISERLEDNVFAMYPDRADLIRLYLNRELTALGDSFNDETEQIVMALFNRLDDDIKDFISSKYAKVDRSLERFSNGNDNSSTHKIDPAHVGRYIRMSRKLALLLGKNRLDLKESCEIFSVEGLEGLDVLVNLAENNQ